jgi:quercetin dioxygenase-like cupin family protein
MRSIVRRPVLAALVGCIVMLSAHHVPAQRRTPITLTRLYAGPDGQTHAEKIEVKLMPSATLSRREESETFKVSSVRFFRWPPGQVQDWHNASQRQYALTLSGRGEVELPGGQKIPLNPGRIFLAEDVTGKGHITRSIGSEDWVFLMFAAQ